MFDSDVKVYNALHEAKENGNTLLQYFRIVFPDVEVATDDNVIFVASVDLENRKKGFTFQEYNSLVEVAVKIKQTDYIKAMKITKTVIREILKVLKDKGIREEATARNIHFSYSKMKNDVTVLKGASMLIQMNEVEDFTTADDSNEEVCQILLEEIIIE